MKTFREAKLGDRLLWASVDADAVKVDLSPRLFVKKRKRDMPDREVSYIENFYCSIDILNENNKANGRFSGYVSVGELPVPFSYDDLKISRFVIDGVEKAAELNCAKSGVFSGYDTRGQDAPGLPVQLRFKETNPWIKSIDLLELEMQTAKPVKTESHSIKITDAQTPVPIARVKGEVSGTIAVLQIEMGSNAAAYPVPSIDVVLDIPPAEVMGCYLDTNYGLRYRAAVQEWTPVDIENTRDKKIEAVKDNFDSAKAAWKADLVFPNIPPDSFTLVFEIITEKSTAVQTLKLENVYVGPE
jgi:hypothetical protein